MSLPADFLDMIAQYELLSPLATDLLTQPEVSIRINRAKGGETCSMAANAQQVPWCQEGFYLNERPSFTFDPAMHQGRYYVQDASSMAIAPIVKELSAKLGNSPIAYLDACAAPGGKTTAAISSLPKDSVVVANEYDFRRAEILAENVAKWGAPNAIVSRGDTARFRKLREVFDIIAVDAPCSGEGMMRKEEKAREQWSRGLVTQCASLQRDILENVWGALKPGGFLIYSTCTFNRSEDEENLAWLIDEFGAESVPLECMLAHSEIAHGINTPNHCYRFLPGRVKGEGLFIAAVRKPGIHMATSCRTTVQKTKKQTIDLSVWLDNGTDWECIIKGEEVYALPHGAYAMASEALKHLDVIQPGVHVATIKGKDIIPAQELALSTALRTDAFPTYAVGLDDAIRYLQKDAFAIDGAPKGYVLLTYEGAPLGFVKNLGNRANNLYPKQWRILSKRPN